MSRIAFVLVCCLGLPPLGEVPCAPVGKGVIQLDGLLGDWRDVPAIASNDVALPGRGRANWDGEHDLGFRIKCNHDAKRLYLAIDVQDDRLVARPRGARGDHVVLRFGGRTLNVFPGDLRRVKRRVRWSAGRPTRIVVVEALQKGGYSIELSMPLRYLPGYRPGKLAAPFRITVADTDRRDGRIQYRLASKRLRLVFAQARVHIDGFLTALQADRSRVRLHKEADVCGDQRIEHVLLVDTTVGIVGQGMPSGDFAYLRPPVRRPKDILWLKLHDLNGDGQRELVLRYVERAQNGRREVVAVYRCDAVGKFGQPFAHEVLKGQGSRRITNRVRFVRRRASRGKRGGEDIVVDQPRAVGFGPDNYREMPSSDVYPIILPWSEETRRIFRFEGDEFSKL